MYQFPVAEYVLKPPEVYTENRNFVEAVQKSILDPLCGIKVLWTPSGYGKSTYVRAVCSELQKQKKITGVIVLDAEGVKPSPTLTAWLASKIGAPKAHLTSWFNHISDLLPDRFDEKPVLIVIDQFDHLHYANKVQSFVVSMAENSVLTKKYVVLLVVSNPDFASQILSWNGGEKIHSVDKDVLSFKWKEEHFEELWKAVASNIQLPELARKQFISACALAGTPGYFLKHLPTITPSNIPTLEKKAQEVHDEWIKGCRKIVCK